MLNIPDPQTVLKELSHLLPIIYSALDYGTFRAQEFFDQQESEKYKMINRYLAPDLVRYYAIQVLEKKGQTITHDEDDLNLEEVPNNGICICYGRYNIRILKSKNGDLPIPGHSKTRQEFYHQLSLNFPSGSGEDERFEKINLLLLWDVSYPYRLGSLSLACPKAGGITKDSVVAHWHCAIPDALLFGDLNSQTYIEDVEVEDLPISLNTSTRTGTEEIP